MTVWRARLAKRPDDALDDPGPRILCGWHVGATYCAAPPIAWRQAEGDAVALPMGLTDQGTPGRFRWNQAHRRDAASGRPSPAAPSDPGYGHHGNAPVPCEVPCRRNHRNLIDWDVAFG